MFFHSFNEFRVIFAASSSDSRRTISVEPIMSATRSQQFKVQGPIIVAKTAEVSVRVGSVEARLSKRNSRPDSILILIRQSPMLAEMPAIDARAIRATQISRPKFLIPLAVNHGVAARSHFGYCHYLAILGPADDAFLAQGHFFPG